MAVALLLVLLACFMLSAPGAAFVDWNNEDFRLTFEPGCTVNIKQDYFLDEGVYVPYIWFNTTGNMSMFGQISVKIYEVPCTTDELNADAVDVIETFYGVEAVIAKTFYEKNGQNVLAVSHRMTEYNNSTTANIGYGRCVVTVSATSDDFPKIIESLTFGLKQKSFWVYTRQ